MEQAIIHVALVVRDYDEAIQFFCQRLHFTLIEDSYQPEQDKRWVLVAPPGSSGTNLLLARASTPEQEACIGQQTGGRVFLFLRTDDFWRDYNEMQANGIKFVRAPTTAAYGTVAVFEDLYGNRWDLIGPNQPDSPFTSTSPGHERRLRTTGSGSQQSNPADMFNYRIGEDIQLRMIEPRHAEELDTLIEHNRAHIKTWSAWLKDDHSIEDTRSFIKRNLTRFAENKGFALAIWHKGEMAGQIEYNYIDWVNRKAEIGYWLGDSFQGKGLATKSCRVLIDYAFNELKLNRIEMHCVVENQKSQKIPKNLGFREEGVVRQAGWLHDHFVDFVIYGMLAHEWQDQQRNLGG